MFGPSDIGINPAICAPTQQSISRLAQATKKNMTELAKGVGTVMRFRLTEPLPATVGASAAAEILKFDGTGFVRQRDGTVHDEEPGGFWTGVVDDEGWCTARDGQEDHYSIIIMEPKSDADTINQSWIDLINSLAPSVEYLSRNVEGWRFGNIHGIGDELDSTHKNGWIGAFSYFGDEAEVGIVHDHAESSPSTNGNWTITKAGVYRFTLTGWGKAANTNNLSAIASFTTSAPSAGAAHTHTVDIVDPSKFLGVDFVSMYLYRKPFGGAIARWADETGEFRGLYASTVAISHFYRTVPLALEWNVKLNAGDRIGLQFTIDTGTPVIFGMVTGWLRIRAQYLGANANVWTLY